MKTFLSHNLNAIYEYNRIDSCEHRKYKMQNTLYSAVLCGRTCFYSHSSFCPISHESTRARSPSSSLYSNTNYTIFFFLLLYYCYYYFIFYNLQPFRKSFKYTIIKIDSLCLLIYKEKTCKR